MTTRHPVAVLLALLALFLLLPEVANQVMHEALQALHDATHP